MLYRKSLIDREMFIIKINLIAFDIGSLYIYVYIQRERETPAHIATLIGFIRCVY